MNNSAKDLGDKVQEAVLDAIRRCDTPENKKFLVALYQGSQEISYTGYERQQVAFTSPDEDGYIKNIDIVEFPAYKPKENKSWMITNVSILTLEGEIVTEGALTRCIPLISELDSLDILLRFLPGELSIGMDGELAKDE